jgi:excisionase family DNA binding protein
VKSPRAESSSSSARYLTTRESAERLGVTINALKTWIREHRLPALKTPGGHHRIAESDLLAFAAALATSARARPLSKPRILIVDDDEALLGTLKDTLASAIPEALVRTATDGYEGLIQVGAFHPDLLVLDVRMPRLDGFEVCRRLKARPDTASIRILAVTAYLDGGVRERIFECGADDLMEKPFAIEKFHVRVRTLIEQKPRPS